MKKEYGIIEYQKIRTKMLRKSFLFGLGAALITGVLSQNWLFSLPVGLFVFIVFNSKSSKWYQTYVKAVSIGDTVDFEYLNKGVEKKVSLPKDSLKAKKIMAVSQGRNPILIIDSPQLDSSIKQYEVGSWDEGKMDEIIQLLTRKPAN